VARCDLTAELQGLRGEGQALFFLGQKFLCSLGFLLGACILDHIGDVAALHVFERNLVEVEHLAFQGHLGLVGQVLLEVDGLVELRALLGVQQPFLGGGLVLNDHFVLRLRQIQTLGRLE